MNFVRFTKTGGSYAPIVSIRKNGAFGLSQGALNRFGLQDGDWYMVLYYDQDAKAVGIQPTRDQSEEGAIKLIKRIAKPREGEKESVSSSISAKSFFEFHNIPCEESRAFRARWDEENRMIVVELNNPVKDTPKGEVN